MPKYRFFKHSESYVRKIYKIFEIDPPTSKTMQAYAKSSNPKLLARYNYAVKRHAKIVSGEYLYERQMQFVENYKYFLNEIGEEHYYQLFDDQRFIDLLSQKELTSLARLLPSIGFYESRSQFEDQENLNYDINNTLKNVLSDRKYKIVQELLESYQ